MGGQLKARFSRLQEEQPGNSSYIYFVRLMREQGVSNKRVLARYFDTFVDKGDFASNERGEILGSVFESLQNKGILATKSTNLPRHEKLVPSPYMRPSHA